jgi:phosphohistidine phosphatase
VAAIAQALRARAVEVAEIRHSGLARARETAEILARVLGPGATVRAVSGLEPEDDPDVARDELDLAREPLMLVGHLPHLGRLASGLLGSQDGELPSFTPGTALGLARVGDGWRLDLLLRPG